MKRGNRRRPAKLKVLSGRDSRGFANGNPEFEPAVMRPPPTWLGREATKFWTENYQKLAAQHVVNEVNWMSFAMVCDLYGEVVEARKAGKKVSASDRTELRRAMCEFGLTPASLGGVDGAPQSTEPSRFAEFMSGP